MITPYRQDGQIDFQAIPALVDYYASHCDGIFAVCQSSEMFYLTLEERVALAKAVLAAAGTRIPVVVSGHVSAAAEDQKEELRRMADVGAQAVVLVSNRMAGQEESGALWAERTQALLDAVPGVSLGIYECPYPYKRLLSPQDLQFLRDSGRFAFFKDTCCDPALLGQRISALAGSGLKLFNANTATLLSSLRQGCAGFSGIMANFHPALYQWLTRHFEDSPEQAQALQDALTLLSWIEAKAYPACAKLHMQMLGLPVSPYSRDDSHKRLPPDIHISMQSVIRTEQRLGAELGL